MSLEASSSSYFIHSFPICHYNVYSFKSFPPWTGKIHYNTVISVYVHHLTHDIHNIHHDMEDCET